MENFFAFFPQYGKLFRDFSTVWKTFSRFFHAMEKMPVPLQRDFPQCGKLFPGDGLGQAALPAHAPNGRAR
jgi:hypothetical protein